MEGGLWLVRPTMLLYREGKTMVKMHSESNISGIAVLEL